MTRSAVANAPTTTARLAAFGGGHDETGGRGGRQDVRVHHNVVVVRQLLAHAIETLQELPTLAVRVLDRLAGFAVVQLGCLGEPARSHLPRSRYERPPQARHA